MALRFKASLLAAALLAASWTGGALAQGLQSDAQADATLARVKQERAAAESEYAASEQVCYTKFFVNNCLDKAKDLRRARLTELRAAEIDANYSKRKSAVEVRDRELEERARADAAEEAAHAANPPAPRPDPADRAAPVPLKKLPAQRQAEYDARERERAAQEPAKAAERAKRVEEARQKEADAQQRQQRVAEKQAERAAKQARRATDAAAKQAAEAEKAKQKAQAK